MNHNLKNKTPDELTSLVCDLGGKKYSADYIFSFIHGKGVESINEITPLSKSLRARFSKEGHYISSLTKVRCLEEANTAKKYLFELSDKCLVESVVLFDGVRKTVCVSCQVGCRMGCLFCATGRLKLERNLTAGEIVDQINIIGQECGKISNVVYMGMGEPFDNYDEVIRSISILTAKGGKEIGQRHITVSTCGMPEGIRRFAGENLQVRLAVSLHGGTDAVRRKIMGIGRKFSLGKVMAAVKDYQEQTGRRVTFEYCMIKDVNDSRDDARKVVGLLRKWGLKANINLIEYNPHKGCAFKGSSRSGIKAFSNILASAGFEVSVRYKRGRKIKAACGQLGASLIGKGPN